MKRPTIDKAAMRAQLQEAYEDAVKQDPEAVTLYAARLPVTKQPWKPKPIETVDLFQEEIERLKAEKEAPPKPEQELDASRELTIDDFPGLLDYRRPRR